MLDEVGIPTTDIVRYYQFNNTLKDCSVSNDTATSTNTTFTRQYGTRYSLTNIATSYTGTTFGNGRDPSVNPVSYVAYIKSDDAASVRMFLANSTGATPVRMYVGHTGGYWSMGIQGTSWTASGVATDSDWHVAIIVLDGSTAYFYIDDTLCRQLSYTSYVFDQNLAIGGFYPTSASYPWVGEILKVMVIDRALTAAERHDIVHAGVKNDSRWRADEFIEGGLGNFESPTTYNGQDGNFWYPNGDNHASYWWTTNYNGTITKYAAGAYLNAPRVDKPTVELYKPGDTTVHATGGRWHGTWSGTYVEPLPLISGEWYYCSFWYKCSYTTVTTITFKLLSTDWMIGSAYDTITINQDGNWHYIEMKIKNTTDFAGKNVRAYIVWSYDSVHAAQTLVINGIEVYRDWWIEGDTKASLSNKRLLTKKQFIEV